MIDNEIQSLAGQPVDRSLEGLEGDIWAGVAVQKTARQTTRFIASCQAGLLIIALVGAATAGASTAMGSPRTSIISAGSELAPSTLLLGRHR